MIDLRFLIFQLANNLCGQAQQLREDIQAAKHACEQQHDQEMQALRQQLEKEKMEVG